MASRQDRANAIRALSMDAVQKAKSGHPGAPMGMADIAEVLCQQASLKQLKNWCMKHKQKLKTSHHEKPHKTPLKRLVLYYQKC